ncbi:MAG TPA: KUP/HAK/KT family potassium transporter, partial [Burkholderiaceae bacterium]|nr:KUP/HAK/KT family potassium transporter [Burkholderiaceae bacterium]
MSIPQKSGLTALTLAAIGIVYGDIGTSPLYTMKEVFSQEHGLAFNTANLLGVVSLIVWGLTIVVSVKYVTLILRADNHGEGGIMALTALALSSMGKNSRVYAPLMLLGLAGATLFYGDSVITPAISVLSAIEGLEIATPALTPYVVPLTVAVLIALYSLQARGTAGIGKWFGPVMTLWFASLAAMGLINIWQTPQILAALNPWHALLFLEQNRMLAFIALGAVVLAFTGAEALYADVGHFGPRPIRVAWFLVVFPALALNYLGQGALLLSNPAAIGNPFYRQLGDWSIYPLVLLSTVATVIASQATISGTFSMTKQAIALGFLPRMRVEHTSASEIGQIYMPLVNWLQLSAVLLAVIGFGSSSHLAAAYGIAVTATMLVTTVLTFFVVRYGWKYNLLLCIATTGFFLVIDLAFFSANLLKVLHGGWFPLLLGLLLFIVMLTWKRGRALVFDNLRKEAVPLEDFLRALFVAPPVRVPGTAIFLRGETDGVPHAMLHNLAHNKVLHERVVFLTV